jgi:hypothetical protein
MHNASVEAGKLAGLFRASLENPAGGGVKLSREQEWPSNSITTIQSQ